MVKEHLTVVTRKGQITVPAEIRHALNLQVGDKVAVSLQKDGTADVTIRPVHSVTAMTFGAITPRRQPDEGSTPREEFIQSATERDERSKTRP